MITKLKTNHYNGYDSDLKSFKIAMHGDTFFTIDTKKYYVYENNMWNLISGVDFTCLDGGNASSTPQCQ